MLDLDWDVLIRPAQTVAIYMGTSNLEKLVTGFLERGVASSTDIALIENGTRPEQKVVTGTLDDIVGISAKAEIKGPAIIMIGSVVQLRNQLEPAKAAMSDGEFEMSLTAGKSTNASSIGPDGREGI